MLLAKDKCALPKNFFLTKQQNRAIIHSDEVLHCVSLKIYTLVKT